MPRDIPVGNGRLLVCFDSEYRIRDIYYPHVGQENHVVGNLFRMGVHADGVFSWVGEGWERTLAYESETLITSVSLYNRELGLLIACKDAVDFHETVYLREMRVENMRPEARKVRLFLTQDFEIYGNSIGDTAVYAPDSGGMVHYKDKRYFLVGGCTEGGQGLSAFAAGVKGVGGRLGAWKDAEDGELSGNPVAQGSVDSVVALDLEVKPLSTGTAWYWICAGQDWDEAKDLDERVRSRHPSNFIRRTAYYWRLWLRKENPHLVHLPAQVRELYRRSLLVILTNVDADGGIVAANDSDLISFNRDTYSYVWGRDGALVAHAFNLAGYPEPAQRFYTYAAKAMTREGYLLHKHNPDGSLASSWHPWYNGSERQLPIQEDETALLLWSLWNHFVLYRDMEFIKPLYRPVIKNAADFMVGHRHEGTSLTAPCYDLWEERWGIPAFTVGAVFGGLTAASLFCSVFGEENKADEYRRAAAEIRDAASVHLWRGELGRFCRALIPSPGGGLEPDPVPDSSTWGLAAFGAYDVEDRRVAATMTHLRDALWLKTDVGGMARLEGDYYHRVEDGLPGNPWFISTLWLADYLVARAGSEQELAEPIGLLEWAAGHALPSGVLSEQLHPRTGAPLSAAPLTWSHAAFVTTTLAVLSRLGRLGLCPECHAPIARADRMEDWLSAMYGNACDAIHGMCRVK